MWWMRKRMRDEIDTARLARVERQLTGLAESHRALAAELARVRKMKGESTRRPRSQIEELLPALDRMHEIALVAMGHPDLAQQFGLTTRQKENEPDVETRWETPTDDPDDSAGLTYE